MVNALISIVVCTHYRPNLLERALKSILNQSMNNTQIILCADEISNDTKEIAKNYLREQDCLIMMPHLTGPASVRNEGIRQATSEKLIFLDDDDTFDLNYIELISKFCINSPSKMHYFNFTKIEETRTNKSITVLNSSKVSQKNNSTNLSIGNFIPINSFVVDTIIAKSIQFDTHLRSHEDWDYLLELNKLTDFTHVDYFGPNVHISHDPSRTSNANKAGDTALDFLSIYRKHPSNDNQTKIARQNQLMAFGINLPINQL